PRLSQYSAVQVDQREREAKGGLGQNRLPSALGDASSQRFLSSNTPFEARSPPVGRNHDAAPYPSGLLRRGGRCSSERNAAGFVVFPECLSWLHVKGV